MKPAGAHRTPIFTSLTKLQKQTGRASSQSEAALSRTGLGGGTQQPDLHVPHTPSLLPVLGRGEAGLTGSHTDPPPLPSSSNPRCCILETLAGGGHSRDLRREPQDTGHRVASSKKESRPHQCFQHFWISTSLNDLLGQTANFQKHGGDADVGGGCATPPAGNVQRAEGSPSAVHRPRACTEAHVRVPRRTQGRRE